MLNTNEPLILAVDLGLTSGLAVGRRARTHTSNHWRLDLYWDCAVKTPELYGALEQVGDEFDVQVIVVEMPVLNPNNPLYKDLKELIEKFTGDIKQLFACPIIEVLPAQWKNTPAIRFKPADNIYRTTHQWDSIRIGCWFALFGILEKLDISQNT